MADRLPLNAIPYDFVCPECQQVCKNNLGYRSHMNNKHGIQYELATSQAERNKISLAKLKENEHRTRTYEQLLPWERIALTNMYVYGLPATEVGESMRKSVNRIRELRHSPAYAELCEAIDRTTTVPQIVKAMMESASFRKMADLEIAWETALEARDYKAMESMAKNIFLKSILSEFDKREVGQAVLHVTFNSDNAPSGDILEADIVETGYEIVPKQISEG
jgi:uncharacterized C2H2 Zn-finger protein